MNKARRIIGLMLVVMTIAAVALLSGGCARDVYYGTWQHKYTSFSDGTEQSEPSLPMVVDIRENGEVYMLDSLYGYYTRDKNTFTFRFKDDEEPWLTGAFRLEGGTMYVYADGSDIMYTMVRVETSGS